MLECWNQTFKSVLRKYCLEIGNSWDEEVPFALFALREAVQDFLGFSPAELVFGRTVQSPLQILKEQILSDDPFIKSTNVLGYVSQFQEDLHRASSLFKEALTTLQSAMKKRYDRKAVPHSFEVGD